MQSFCYYLFLHFRYYLFSYELDVASMRINYCKNSTLLIARDADSGCRQHRFDGEFSSNRWCTQHRRRCPWYDIRTGRIIGRVMCSTSYNNDLNWDMCPGDDGRARMILCLVDNKGERPLPRRETAVGRRWRSTGQGKKKRLPPGTQQLMLTWKPMPACIPAWVFFCTMPSARIHSQKMAMAAFDTQLHSAQYTI